MADKKITELTAYTPPIDTDVLPIVDITTSTTKKITWANIVEAIRTATLTLTNKTLTTPVIASMYQDAGKTKLMTTPNTASDTLAAIAATQTLTNKTLTTPVIASIYQDAGKTKLLTVPDTASDTLTANAATQTLSAKTLTSPTINSATITGTITGISSGDNLLLNPGFIDSNADNLPDYWTLHGTPTLAIATDTLFVGLGGNQATMTATAADAEGIEILGGTANWLKVKPSTIYMFSVDYKCTAGDVLAIIIISYNGAAAGTTHISVEKTETTATRYSGTFTTDATATNLRIVLRCKNSNDIVIVSHPKLEEGSVATPFLPIANDYPERSGWMPATDAWTYASANTITVTAGAVSIYQKGDKVKFVNTTLKYGVIIAVADTLLTIAINTDYVVANAAITNMYYSHIENPMGYPDYFAYTPTGPTNTTLTGRFKVSNKTCEVSIKGAVTGAPDFTNMPTLPIAASASMLQTVTSQPAGTGGYIDTGTATVNGATFPIVVASATTVNIVSAAAAAYTDAVPITWANTDFWWVTFDYEI